MGTLLDFQQFTALLEASTKRQGSLSVHTDDSDVVIIAADNTAHVVSRDRLYRAYADIFAKHPTVGGDEIVNLVLAAAAKWNSRNKGPTLFAIKEIPGPLSQVILKQKCMNDGGGEEE